MRVLHVIGGMGLGGGAPSFLINNMPLLANCGVFFDFLIRKDNCCYNNEIKKNGGNVYVMPDYPKHYFKNIKETKKFFKANASLYDCVHIHANALLYTLPVFLSRKYKIKKIIIHSHNTKTNVPLLKLLHFINRAIVLKDDIVCIACGKEAGKWMFGRRPFTIINNSIDKEKYRFNLTNREEIRKKYKISKNEVLIGHVGRFTTQKNHDKLIDIFFDYHKINPNSKLMLLGEGQLFSEIKSKVEFLDLDSCVIFCGNQIEIEKYYSAFDIIVFPSKFEGLPFVLVEAQASGCPCLISDTITNEAIVSDIVCVESITSNSNAWIDLLEKMLSRNTKRETYADNVAMSGYGLDTSVSMLKSIYEK